VFSFAVFPKAVEGKLSIGAEGINDLAKVAGPMLRYEGTLRWQESLSRSGTTHPEFARYAKVMAGLTGARAERATQFFGWCLIEGLILQNPERLEEELEACVELLRSR